MKVKLDGRLALLVGRESAVTSAVAAALATNGAYVGRLDPGEVTGGVGSDAPEIAIVVHELAADGVALDHKVLIEATESLGVAMTAGGGRIIVVTTAFGLIPARRHQGQSVATATTISAMRGLAMRLGPKVLVNAVGAGAILDDAGGFLAGSAAMLDHVPNGAAGEKEDIVNAVLFLADPMNTYLTGQVLTVDGGWGAGYGRNF